MLALGWQMAFVITGIASLIWLAAWLLIYRRLANIRAVAAANCLDRERSAEPGRRHRLDEAAARPRDLGLRAGKFLIDPIWWMFLFWLPDFFAKRYHLDLKSFGPPLVAVYLLSDVGSVAGGWFSGALMKWGFSLNAARKTAMLTCAVLVTPVTFAMYAGNLWLAVGIIGLGRRGGPPRASQPTSTPCRRTSSRRRRGEARSRHRGAAGAVGGMLMAEYAGWVLQKIGSYTPIFVVAASVYLIAVLVIHLLSPRMEPVEFSAA